jgi:hypothetical protein
MPVEGLAALGADGGAVVAETPPGLWRGAVSAEDLHPDIYCGAAARPSHRAAAADCSRSGSCAVWS